MTAPLRFPFINLDPSLGNVGLMPVLPIILRSTGIEITDLALVDTGATTNVLPFDLGVQLGLNWARSPALPPLGGMLAGYPAKAVLLEGLIGMLPPVPLAFAWTQGPVPRTLLGQTNFFLAFDVFFYRARSYFEIQPASAATP